VGEAAAGAQAVLPHLGEPVARDEVHRGPRRRARGLPIQPDVSARAGYRYIWSISDIDPPDQRYREHRPIGELSLHAFPGASLLLLDRNRVDLRFINGVYSYRYRNRLRLERTFAVDRWTAGRALTPYAMEELGYDSRYGEFNRSRFTVDLETTLTSMLMVDLSFVRQDDSRASVEHLNALGLTLNLTY
jgi:hypothetical protein